MAVSNEDTSGAETSDEDTDEEEDGVLDATSFDYDNKPHRNRLNAVLRACVQEVCL